MSDGIPTIDRATQDKELLRKLRRRVNKARDFPTHTCPASRHLHIMADCLTNIDRNVKMNATISTVVYFTFAPGRIDYQLVDGQGSVSFSREQRIVINADDYGTFTISFEQRTTNENPHDDRA